MRSAIFADVAAELLVRGHSARFRAPGCSMSPAILDGEAITVEPVRPPEVRMDDIVLYRAERRVIAHRVVGIDSESEAAPIFILRGDAAGSPEERVESRQILGRVSAVERKGWGARLLHTARLGAGRLKGRMDSYRRGIAREMLRRFTPGVIIASGHTVTTTATDT
jgi:signal peptidase I